MPAHIHSSRGSAFLASLWHFGFTAIYYHKFRTVEGRAEKFLYGGALMFHLAAVIEHLRDGLK